MKLKESEPQEDLEEEVEDSDANGEAEADGDADTDNVGDASVEINVEALIQELEVQGLDRPLTEYAAKRRVEELLEQKRARRELEDFEDYDI